jgi:hypothetical protein
VGLPVLNENISDTKSDGVEKGLMLFDESIEGHADDRTGSDVVRLGVSEGVFRMNGSTTLNISTASGNYNYTSTRLSYFNTDDSQNIIYDFGAILRASETGSFMTQGPDFQLQNNVLHLRVSSLQGDDTFQPTRSVAIRSELKSKTTHSLSNGGDNITLYIGSKYTTGWVDKLNSKDRFSCTKITSTKAKCVVENVELVQIQHVSVEIRFDQ